MEKSNLTRKAFLSMALGATSMALTPKDVLAAEEACEISSTGAQEAMRLWEKACSEATAAGEPIVRVDYPEKQRRHSGSIVAAASDRRVTGVTSGTFTTVAGQPEVIKAVAVYWVGSGGFIGAVEDAWISGTSTKVAHYSYSYTKLDGGQTLAVSYTATLTNYINFNQVFSFYAEFYDDGSGWMNGGWV